MDRTFNCSHSHAMEIWEFLEQNDNGVTNFHFEIAADLLTQEELGLLGRLRPGQVQLEILQRLVRERFGMEVSFGAGAVRCRETQ